MCSTPRPRIAVKGKATKSGSILSSFSAEDRSRFAERANAAQERRYQMVKNEQQKNRKLNTTSRVNKKAVPQKQTINKNKKKQSDLNYWLVSASLKDIFFMLFFGKYKRT